MEKTRNKSCSKYDTRSGQMFTGLTLRHTNNGSDPKRQLGQCDPSKTLLLNFKPIYWNLLHRELTANVGDLKLLKSLKAHCIILNIEYLESRTASHEINYFYLSQKLYNLKWLNQHSYQQ